MRHFSLYRKKFSYSEDLPLKKMKFLKITLAFSAVGAPLLCLFFWADTENEPHIILNHERKVYVTEEESSVVAFLSGAKPSTSNWKRNCLLRHNSSLTSDDFDEDLNFLTTDRAKNYKTILAIEWFHINYGTGFGYKPFEEACCEERRCFITARRTLIKEEKFDAVLFQGEKILCANIPRRRLPNQRWIYYAKEPPMANIAALNRLNSLNVNWTMTFRTDSDIVAGYGDIFRKENFPIQRKTEHKRLEILEENLKSKTKLIAWVVSHCKTVSKRENYVRDMEKYVKVDVFGDCGPLKCPTFGAEKCFETIGQEYKFYLAFENSFCRDYITEKFFKNLKYNIVPVVRGSGNYESIAPRHSYIDARDFSGPRELANYLLYLDRNATAYAEYFKWKKDYEVLSIDQDWMSRGLIMCKLCKKLHEQTEPKTYTNLKKWLIEGSECGERLKNIF